MFVSLLVAAVSVSAAERSAAPARQTIPLNGEWSFQREGAPADEWKTVQVPSSFQSHEGTNFHGVGIYRKMVEPFELPRGKRALLEFRAAATEAQVWWNGQKLGTHLGGWTPFRFDVTDLVRKAPANKPHEIRVRLDEKVGHNTQGFLPIIAPHFGGLWQDVRLLVVPETYIEDLELMSVGDPATDRLRVEFPLAGSAADSISQVKLSCRLRGETSWTELSPTVLRTGQTLKLSAPVANPRLWSPAEPNLYEIEIALPGSGGDRIRTRAAFRSMTSFGPQFRLNGQPVSIRGVLNWGYSAPMIAPNPGEATWLEELEFIKSRGFNLMKYCLWVPPQRYLELADEMGVMTWMEYPTWHPDFSEKYLEPLRKEFREFFCYDRNHPSVILRSLTCETGPSAQLKVIQSLYDSAHELIPGVLVEDDSSWIGWNRINDFYDDHPYGNNHTWVKTLDGFNEYILAHGLKPMVLGETTAADTWVDRAAMLKRLGQERPWWAPSVLDDMERWTERMRALAGPDGLDQLRPDSLRYGMLMRKFQIEAYRREIPYGGYVITVLRDIPNCSMGLIDYNGKPKWSEADWSWQRDTICLLKTENDRRSFSSGEHIHGQILLSHFGLKPIDKGELEVTLQELNAKDEPGAVLQRLEKKDIGQHPATLAELADLDWPAPDAKSPVHLQIRAILKTAQGEFHNEWPIWVVPAADPAPLKQVQVHHSVDPGLARELFPGAPPYNHPGPDSVVVTSQFDDEVTQFLESGGRVLLLPNGERGSFALNAHWFLRGAPYIPHSAISDRVPHALLLELQHFDLASEVVPNLAHLDSFDPILLLWDTHDQSSVKTHGLVFETRVGQGRLLVSALRHGDRDNASGRWLLSTLVRHLEADPPPRHALPGDVWDYLKAKLDAEQTNLVSRTWRFKPDPNAEGLEQGWASPKLASDADWKDIRIGAWWESQGYPALDHWAWYRLWVDVPEHWKQVFLSFEGVDDMYELYVNGELAGKSGDLATRKDALNEKKSYNITRFVTPGQKALIAVRVYDWYGAGGIFRPVTLGTLAFNPALDLLK